MFRFEKKSHEVVYGCHGYIDPTSKYIIKFYVADSNGYHEYGSDLKNFNRYDEPQQFEE